MKDFDTTMTLEEELERLKKKDRFYNIILVGLIATVAFFGVKLYIQNSDSTNTGYSAQSIANQSSVQVSNQYGQQPPAGGTGGGCGGGSGGGCGSSGGGGCGSSGGGSQVSDPQLEQQVLEMYKSEFGSTNGLTAVVLNLGCHQEINIIDKDKNLVKRYQLRSGQISLLAQ